MSDMVNHPNHYNSGNIEVIDFIEGQKLGFNLGNTLKYISRNGKKSDNEIEDLEKAKWYLEREIETKKNKPIEIGDRFGSLVVTSLFTTKNKSGTTKQMCNVRCDCGNNRVVVCSNLKSGNTKSCGCQIYKRYYMIGKTFGDLTVIGIVRKNNTNIAKCVCICGKIVYVKPTSLITNHTRSCGCVRKRTKVKYDIGMYKDCYHVWWNMIQRCENKKAISYPNYGGRGISVCEEWHDFENFYKDMGKRPKGKQLDRIDNDGNYCKENCRWVSSKENMRNRNNKVFVTYNGVRQQLTDFKHKNKKFLINHRYDGTLLIEGGKYDNKEWYMKFHGMGELDNE